MTKDCIRITGLEAIGRHGVLASERTNGQPFVVDLVAWFPLDTVSDELSHTVNYAELAEGIVAIVGGPPVDLIETLAGRIADFALSYPLIERVSVTVHKPRAPIAVCFADVAVTINRRRT